MQVWGYHGTSLTVARRIAADGVDWDRCREQNWHWLGSGFYLWQDGPLRAHRWAAANRGQSARGSVRVAVVGVRLDLSGCLDLLDVAWAEELEPLGQKFAADVRALQTNGLLRELPRDGDGRHPLDCAFFDMVIEEYRSGGVDLRSVRGAFAEGSPLFEGSYLGCMNHVQINVVDPTAILEMQVMTLNHKTWEWRVET